MKTIAEHARDVLIETDNYGVMFGDAGLLDSIAERAGYEGDPKILRKLGGFHRMLKNRWNSVLSGVARRPDLFVMRRDNRNTRVFWLRECVVDGKPQFPSKLGLQRGDTE